MKKILALVNFIALSVTILVNYLSNTGLLNGNTMKTMSDKYFNYFTPSGYAFSIWGLIYLGLFGFVIYSGRQAFKKDGDQIVLKIGWWFILSCCANSLWVIAWLYDYTALSVLLMAVIFLSLLKIILNTRYEGGHHSLRDRIFIFWPFGIYFGWISVAFIANTAALLTKVNWDGWGLSEVTWTIVMIVVAGIVNVLMVKLRNLHEYALVGVWAIIAIAVSNIKNNGSESIINACYLTAGVVFIFILIGAFTTRLKVSES